MVLNVTQGVEIFRRTVKKLTPKKKVKYLRLDHFIAIEKVKQYERD